MARCLVTGGAGFIGSNLTDKLIELGHEVTVVDNLEMGRRENVNPKATFVYGEVTDPSSWNRNLEIDVIFHLAALARIQPSFEKPWRTYFSNSAGTFAMLEWARKIPSVKFVYAGSSSAYFDVHANPYAYTKYIGEEHCKLYSAVYDLSTVICRFFNVYGKRMTTEGAYATVVGIFAHQYKNNEPLTITGTGEQRRDFTHVDDIVNGLIAASQGTWKGKIFNLGKGSNYSINEVAKMFNHETTYIPARRGEADTTLADIKETCELLNWKPTKELCDFVQEIRHGDQ